MTGGEAGQDAEAGPGAEAGGEFGLGAEAGGEFGLGAEAGRGAFDAPDPRGGEFGPGAKADPDATPTATPWQEYLAAAQSLDAVVRKATVETAAASRVTGPARAELAALRQRLDQQRARLIGEAVRFGLWSPELAPTATELAEARTRVTANPAGYADALRDCRFSLDLAEAAMHGAGVLAPPISGGPPFAALPASVPPVSAAPPVTAPPATSVPPAPSVLSPPAPLLAGPPPPVPPPPGTPPPGTPPPGTPPPGTPPSVVPRPASRWLPPPPWALIGVPLGAAAVLICGLSLLLILFR